jgi:UDP-N-acetylmuramoyl-tripeptide--D-alanyl-D-alanine ligase
VTDLATPRPSPGGMPDPGLTADELAAATTGRLLARSSRHVLGAAVDSREAISGNLFVALPGERTDGHRFIGEAIAAGVAGLLVARPPDPPLPPDADVTVLLVDDTLRGLQAIAAHWRTRFDPLVVGVTGSIAKTSAKEAIATVLASTLVTLRNEGNKNNEIGLPLTLMRLRPDHQAAVLEMGMYTGGEIAELAAMARPEIGVVTAVQPVHLSRIGTIEAVEKAKGELVEALPSDGVAVLNADDERVRRMGQRTRARVVTYGFAREAAVTASKVESAGVNGMSFYLETSAGDWPVTIPTLGRLSVHNALAAAAVGLAAGMPLERIAAALAAGWSAPHRMQPIRVGGVTIIDDSYNASPGSVTAALEVLAGFPGRRIAVIGEMLELGSDHEAGHERVGKAAAGVVDRLIVVGNGAQGVAGGARGAGLARDRISLVSDRPEALERLLSVLEDGDVVLVKASRGIALDVLVDELQAALESRDAR